jgi:hypothetical protein
MASLKTFRCPKCARTVRVIGSATTVQHRCPANRLDWVAFKRTDYEEAKP